MKAKVRTFVNPQVNSAKQEQKKGSATKWQQDMK